MRERKTKLRGFKHNGPTGLCSFLFFILFSSELTNPGVYLSMAMLKVSCVYVRIRVCTEARDGTNLGEGEEGIRKQITNIEL